MTGGGETPTRGRVVLGTRYTRIVRKAFDSRAYDLALANPSAVAVCRFLA